jgi:ATP synthase in type III secretion protein N
MSASSTLDIDRYLSNIDQTSPVTSKGRVKEVIGLLVRAIVPEARVGELCLILNSRLPAEVKAEVVGFQGGDVLLMALGDLADIGPESEVVPTGRSLTIRVGENLLGRVLTGLGEPMDAAQ